MNARESQSRNLNVILGVIVVSMICTGMMQLLVAPALPNIQSELNATEASTAWLISAYLLTASIATPISGRLGDMFGKNRVMLVLMALFAAGVLLAAVAQSIELLIVARMIQGLSAGIYPLTIGVVRDEFPADKVAGAVGRLSAAFGIASGLMVVGAGLVVDSLSYRWLFWIPLMIALPTALAIRWWIPDSPVKTGGRVNWTSAVLAGTGIGGVLLAISQGSSWGWGAPATLGLLALGAVLVALWVWHELESDDPLVDMRMMRIRGVWTANATMLLVGIAMYSTFVLVPQIVQLPESTGFGLGGDVVDTSLYLLPSSILIFISGLTVGPILARFGNRALIVFGLACAIAGFIILLVAHDAPETLILGLSMLGLGIGFLWVALPNLVVESVPQHQTGVAAGMNAVMRTIGGAIGGQLMGSLLASNLAADGYPAEHGLNVGFWVCIGVLAVAAVVALAIPRRRTAEPAIAAEALAPEPV